MKDLTEIMFQYYFECLLVSRFLLLHFLMYEKKVHEEVQTIDSFSSKIEIMPRFTEEINNFCITF